MKILLVDDDPAYLEVLRFFLERDGIFNTETATSAKDALEKLSSNGGYEAVVSDFMMPEIDGLEFLKILRTQGSTIPFIMLTGRGREDVAIQALNSGADFYIPKGGDPKTQYPELSNMLKKSIEQKRAESRVVESEKMLASIFECIQDGISVLDAHYNILRVNSAMERWYDYSMPLIGKKCYEAYHGRDAPCLVCPTNRTLAYGISHREVVPKINNEGRAIGWFELFSFPMVNKSTGEVEQVIEYVRDISEQENSRNALLASENRYRQLIELANVGIMLVNMDGEITFSNPRFSSLLGHSGDSIEGLSLYSFMEGPWVDRMKAFLERLSPSKELQEFEIIRNDGSKLQVLLGASPIADSGNKPMGSLIVASDITDSMRMMDALVSSENKFSAMFRASPHMLLICRRSDKHIIEVNERLLRITGFARGELLGHNVLEIGFFESDFCKKVEAMVNPSGHAPEVEAKFMTKSGEYRLARLTIEEVELDGEKCVMFAGRDITDESMDSTEIRRERDVLRSVLDSTPDCVVIANLEGTIVDVNNAVMDLYSFKSRDDVIGKSAFALLGVEDGNAARSVANTIIEKGKIDKMPFRLNSPSGIYEGELTARLVKDPLGKPIYMLGILRDMTTRILYEKALKRSLGERKELEGIISESPAVVFLWRNERGWPIEFVSENVESLGYNSKSLMQGTASYEALIHPEDVQRVVSEAKDHLARGDDSFSQVYRIVSPTGDVHWVDGRIMPRRVEAGAVTHLQGIVIDVTDRKRIEELLSMTEARFKAFMDNSPAVAFMKDANGRYLYVNKAMEDAMGMRGSELVGKTDSDLFPEETATMLREVDAKVLGVMESQETIEMIPQLDGPHEWLAYKFPVPDPSGDGFVIGGVRLDISDLRRYERAIEQANTKLSLLSSITRHDILNQLSIVLGWSDLLLQSPNDKNSLRYLQSINKAAHLIRRQLEFTADYQEVGVKTPMWTRISESVQNGVAGLDLREINLTIDLPEVSIYADQMIEKVFHNLIENSIRHGEKVTGISISHTFTEGDLVIIYEDNGIGISDINRENLFQRGFGKHTGLGLYMAREILGITGIRIEERGEQGKGVRFEVSVPKGAYRNEDDSVPEH